MTKYHFELSSFDSSAINKEIHSLEEELNIGLAVSFLLPIDSLPQMTPLGFTPGELHRVLITTEDISAEDLNRLTEVMTRRVHSSWPIHRYESQTLP